MFCDILGWFWRTYPALLYGLFLVLGLSVVLNWHLALIIPIMVLVFPIFQISNSEAAWLTKKQIALGCLLLFTALIYCHWVFLSPDLPQAGISGQGIFQIESITDVDHPTKGYKYKGILLEFTSKGDPIAKHIPTNVFIKKEWDRPPGNVSYQVRGTLKQRDGKTYTLKVDKKDPWIPVADTWSLAELRYRSKADVRSIIQQSIASPQGSEFLTGILIGEFHDKVLLLDFGRVGVQHLLAISGFHFSLIAAIFGAILRLFFSPRITAAILIVLLTSYFLFIGSSPSVERAWTTFMVFLGGQLLKRRPSSINSLGVAFIVVCITNPLSVNNLGFMLSFLATASIIIFYQMCDEFLQKLFSKRRVSEVVEMNKLDQHGYVLGTFFRQAMALNLAVHLTATPVLLYHFHTFPFLSLIYNLFIPFLATFSMLFLIIGLLIGLFIPPIGQIFHWLNTVYTNFVLQLITGVPPSIDFRWSLKALPFEWLLAYLTLIFLAGIFFKHRLELRSQEQKDWLF